MIADIYVPQTKFGNILYLKPDMYKHSVSIALQYICPLITDLKPNQLLAVHGQYERIWSKFCESR